MFSHLTQVLTFIVALSAGAGCFSSPTPHPGAPDGGRATVDAEDGLSHDPASPSAGVDAGGCGELADGADAVCPADSSHGGCDAGSTDVVAVPPDAGAPECEAGEADDNVTAGPSRGSASGELGERPSE